MIPQTDSPPRSLAVFFIAVGVLVLLWLPPWPFPFHASQFPGRLCKILVGMGLVQGDEFWQLRWDYLGLPILGIYAIFLTWRSRPTWTESGLTVVYFKEAWRSLRWPTLVGAVILVLLGVATHPVEFTDRFWKRLVPIPAFFQQLGIQLFFQRQLYPWFGKSRTTAWIVTGYFVVLHAPNPGLMLGTLVGMYFWARSYQKTPNLYALSISHALLSAVLMQTMPKWLLPSVSVGLRFWEKGEKNNWWGWKELYESMKALFN